MPVVALTGGTGLADGIGQWFTAAGNAFTTIMANDTLAMFVYAGLAFTALAIVGKMKRTAK